MNLLIISATTHFEAGGQIVGLGPVVAEIDHLATLFSRVVHIAPLHKGQAPAMMCPYANPGIRFVAVKPAGGPGWLGKLDVLFRAPGYLRTMLAHLGQTDAVHVRCPSNIGLLAILLLAVIRGPKRRWVKYAGEWMPRGPEPASYRLQRWWLRRGFSRSFVTVNGTWSGQPAHVRSFRNPSLTEDKLSRGRTWCDSKQLTDPVRLVFAGRLSESKGAIRAIQVLARVLDAGFAAELDLAGDGPDRKRIERSAADLDVLPAVTFHGWLARAALDELYAKAHFLVLPSESEGWPKVLSESMAFGVVPLASDAGSIPQVLGECGAGRWFRFDDTAAFASAVVAYRRDPETWKRHSRLALRAARLFTYAEYLAAVSDMLGRPSQSGTSASRQAMELAAAGPPLEAAPARPSGSYVS